MFNQIIEFIKDSVTTVVGLAVGVLGIGDAAILNLQDVSVPTDDTVVSKELSKIENEDIFTSQLASISQALQSVLPAEENEVVQAVAVVLEEGDGEAVAPTSDQIILATVPTTEYFDRADIKEAVFSRPTSVLTSDDEVIQIQETELIRPLNPIKSTKQAKPVEVSVILETDFDNFDTNLHITEITEDDSSFYITYRFRTLAIKNKVWKETLKEKNMVVTKAILESEDLGNYLSEELGEVADNEIVFLKEVQEIQRVKKIREDALTASVQEQITRNIASEYSALIGKTLDVYEESFDGYTPVEKDEQFVQVIVQDTQIEIVSNQIPESGTIQIETIPEEVVIDNEAPIIIIQGNNPALIQVGSGYSDLGAQVVDNININLGVKTGGDIVDTSTPDSYFIIYTATDEAGNTAQATREVIVYDYEVTPEVSETISEDINATEDEIASVSEQIEEENAVFEETMETELTNEPLLENETKDISDEETKDNKKDKKEKKDDTTASDTSVIEIAVDATTDVVDTVADAVNDTVDAVVEQVAETVNEATGVAIDQAVNAATATAEITIEVAETVSEVVSEVAETGVEQTTKTLEDVSETIEAVAEEVSAMIRSVNIMKLLGNIRSALQTSVVVAGEGTGDVLDATGQFLESVADNTYQAINQAVNGLYNIILNSWYKVGLGGTISKISDNTNGIIANINNYAKETASFGADENDENSEYREPSFVSVIISKTTEVATKVVDDTINVVLSLTATVKDFTGVVSADIKNVGGEINRKIEDTNFNPVGIIKNATDIVQKTALNIFNFFQTHRPF